MLRVGGHKAAVAGRFWRIAALAAAGAIGSAAQAEAALFYWPDSSPGYDRHEPAPPQRQQQPRRHQARKIVAPEKESAKPRGPLIIAISIEKQNLKIYDANGLFAETPVSTGMKGHPTPMGVFSVIQKHRLHHSNIYSGAQMPYMQRITWSGIAIHAGVLPGYPASHGCIRMPMAFAVKMWNWTRMGARVVVTPGEMTPASFSHPLLVTQKIVPQPATEPQADAPPATKSDKASEAAPPVKPAISEASLELRSTVGHDGRVKLAMEEPLASTSLREQIHTADASGDMPATQLPATMTDAAPSVGNVPPREGATAETGSAGKKPDEAAVAAPPVADAASSEVFATGSTKPEKNTAEKKLKAKTDEVKPAAANPDPSKTTDKPVDTVTAMPGTGTSVPDPATVAAPKRSGQLAVFVSRKDSKLYVRQNFVPLFDAPVTIAPSDRPLGTHVFTARLDKDDANIVRWSVVSLPAPSRHAGRREENQRSSRRGKIASVTIEATPSPAPDSPTEALDRLTIPAEAMARIAEALSTGASIIVSDEGIGAGETGEGTDFIVALR